MAYKMGLGRARHIETRFLWIQERLHCKELELLKVDTAVNTADLGTKLVDAKTLNRLLDLMPIQILGDWKMPALLIASFMDSAAAEIIKESMDGSNYGVVPTTTGTSTVIFYCIDFLGLKITSQEITLPFSFVLIIMISIWAWIKFFHKSTTDVEKNEKTIGHVMVQSQTSYKYWYEQPRFVPLGKDNHGAWRDDMYDMYKVV